jgi:hypothetical protein
LLPVQNAAFETLKWRGANRLKIRSGTTGVAVNQTADRTLMLVIRAEATL